MKIFLVEDNEDLNHYMTDTFIKLGYDVTSCCDGKVAFSKVDQFFDLYLVDINLPNLNGLELIKRIKSVNIDAKVFIISGDDNIDTILEAYNLGCNDYIKKPFDLREIIAKIKVIFESKIKNQIKLTNDCYYHSKNRVVNYKNDSIKLTKKEANLLDILVKNKGEMVSTNEIELAVWGENFANGHTRQLVSKLKKILPCSEIIQNHSSNGYGIII
ncbi:MAG: response regulator transcription factor [Campylobacterota bacterium]|nr:response regulator transcription factor [Campylobacterota bacterium]